MGVLNRQFNGLLHGRDDIGVEKRGCLYKRTTNMLKQWKKYEFEISRLCLICYKTKTTVLHKTEPKSLQQNYNPNFLTQSHRKSMRETITATRREPKLKIELGDIRSVQYASGNKLKRSKTFYVIYGSGQRLELKGDTVDATVTWVNALKSRIDICTTKKQIQSELKRASFKRHVEQNVRAKLQARNSDVTLENVPKITYLNRTSWDQRVCSGTTLLHYVCECNIKFYFSVFLENRKINRHHMVPRLTS